MSLFIYISRQPAWFLFQRMHQGWTRANYPYPVVNPKLSLHYIPFMRKSKPRPRPRLWFGRELGRFGKQPRKLFPYPLRSPANQLVYRPFMRKTTPKRRKPMFQITALGVHLRIRVRSFVNPPDPRIAAIQNMFKPFMRKNRPKGRKPLWQTTELGVKRYKRLNRDYPLPYTVPFVPWNSGPIVDPRMRKALPILGRIRTLDPKLQD